MTEYNCQIKVQPEDIILKCNKGDILLEVLQRGEIDLQADCGGKGDCGRCQIKLEAGEDFKYRRSEISSGIQLKKDYYLACQLIVEGDLVISIPRSSRLSGQQILTGSEEDEDKYLRSVYRREMPSFTEPLYKRRQVSLTPPSLQDNTADRERLLKEIKEQSPADSDYELDYSQLFTLADRLRENDWEISAGEADYITHHRIIDLTADEGEVYGIAVDIGTTTVVASLIDLETGEELGRSGEYNQQSRYGEDVISRINYASKNKKGIEKVHRALIKTINSLIEELTAEYNIETDDVKLLMTAGNTTMAHTLYGVDPNHIRRSPFTPTFAYPPPLAAEKLDLNIYPAAPVYSFPAIGSFVGGDIIAGVLASGLHQQEELTMLIDIGTNGEIVIGNSELLIACSASAGPAFEGGGISCGVRAMEGAIEQVEVGGDYRLMYSTINDQPPVGICGTGLIDLLATLQEADIINRSGRFNRDLELENFREREDGTGEFLLVPAEQSATGNDMVLTEHDIKHVLRSKAAIYAGIKVMLSKLSFTEQMIEQVYIAGGFGNYLNIEASIRLGLFPDLPRERFHFIGNSSLQGAKRALLVGEEFKEARDLAHQMTYLELGSEDNSGEFMDEFVAAQFIPHTNLSLFSSVTV